MAALKGWTEFRKELCLSRSDALCWAETHNSSVVLNNMLKTVVSKHKFFESFINIAMYFNLRFDHLQFVHLLCFK